ncbi:guanine nucleotide exchange factor in mesoderm [Aphomia sociella]
MDGANADSDHSMTWEDIFGISTDLTPTLIGIYDSLLEPGKSLRPEESRLETAKDARNDPPVEQNGTSTMTKEKDTVDLSATDKRLVDPSRLAGSVKLPIATINKSSLYSNRTISDKNGASDKLSKCDLISSDTIVKENKIQRTFKETKFSDMSTFDKLSPNVKRMISSATETTTLKFQKKSVSATRTSMRHKSNIPLVGATSKISQSGVEILPSVEIYDQPCDIRSSGKTKTGDSKLSESKIPQVQPKTKLEEYETCYDVPMNNCPIIYDVPSVANKTAFESLSLPYIDQSIELSISSNDREFDIKLSSKENSPQKAETKSPTPEASPAKFPKVNRGTNSLCRKDFVRIESPAKQLSKSEAYPEVIGSTGNLKTCVPEKDTSRLNAPSVEVCRPLSMSSIASSSSTSSSGVQNKGGVNSAYLASIESLDDHSDADMTSANGSNNFVNDAGILNTSVSEEGNPESMTRHQIIDEMSGLSQLERVCAEIVQTENVYVEDLRQVVEGYLHLWRRESTFSDDELSELFNNIEDIYDFNRSLCEELNSCRLDATCIARCFVNNTTGFSVYTSYCTGYPQTMKRLAALASEPDSAREFRERQIALCHPLPLASYLLKPVQRILKYHLLLQNVVKQCTTRETEYALLKMTGIAQHIDDMKRRHEHAVRVQEIQSLLYGWSGPDLTTYGELCAEGTFRVFGAKAMRHAFLFDKMLLITKNREDGILAYKTHIMCNNMMLVEAIAGAPLSFHVIPWDAPRAQITLQARSARHKREWTLLIKRVILENYNAVIPSHARQLVMELGQNRTDDDILAEKSHNLITQASMRKQLSAPEYLEKRKLERERRRTVVLGNGLRVPSKKGNRKYTNVQNVRTKSKHDCDCIQFSAEKGADYTCENCYVDLCSDCETEMSKDKIKNDKCCCRNEDNDIIGDKCPECDRSLHYIDSGSIEQLERKQSGCKCSDFKSSQESFGKEFSGSLTKTRGYHSSDNIVGYTDSSKSKDDLSDTNNSMVNVRNITKTCLKCAEIKENIAVTDSTSTLHSRKSRCSDTDKHKPDTTRSKSKDDPQRSKLSKISTWRRKSEPGLPQNSSIISKRSQYSDSEKNEVKGCEKIEFECRNCGSNKITRKIKDQQPTSDPELDSTKRQNKLNLEIKMYNTKNVPKKISKLKKNRAKRLGSDTTAKFYADFSTDVSTENILHISESKDSLIIDKTKNTSQNTDVTDTVSKDNDIDEETYKKLIEKTDSFKKNELEKVKYLNKQKVINEGMETDEKTYENDSVTIEETCDEEKPLEQIISQLLLENREFQKLLKKQQQRNSAQRRHQRLLKSHSNPEQVIIQSNCESLKLKPKYSRQTSENLDVNIKDEPAVEPTINSHIDEVVASEEDHIYETLRCENKDLENLHTLNSKSKTIQHHTHVIRPRRLPSPPNIEQVLPQLAKIAGPDSDYVYLTFDQLNKSRDEESIYDVPISPPKVNKTMNSDYYEHMENKRPATTETDNLYDSLQEVCRRRETPNTLPDDYLPMSASQQSPNTPEIWLSRQKEHFNVSRDRKSGSLPRSFQIVTSNQEDNNLSTFKCKPNSNSKTYLNRDGKVMSTDRPFTIASDKSEISYDDVENYMSEGDILKFNKNPNSNDIEYTQNISQSTLELEEEIDRCYKNNFEEINLDKNKNENLLTVSQPNLNISTTSSCEILPTDHNDANPTDVEVIHPEHKIYKPTSNILSLKNVLSRFKSRKSTDDTDNANDQSSPDSVKSDIKSPSNEKKTALNPRNYSKNLLQRFRNIIGDEHPDDNQNKSELIKTQVSIEDTQNQNNLIKTDIKLVITSTIDDTSTISTVSDAINNDLLSKSVCENSTLTDSQNEKNNLEILSYSCDNIQQNTDNTRPVYEKTISLITNIPSVNTIVCSPSRPSSNSHQSSNKLPIYMQGSKLLGARIAQSDYLDPTTLTSDKSAFKNVNVLINKSAVRPDSLFSNSSFVTSSSEGAYQEPQIKETAHQVNENKDKLFAFANYENADESYYEKSFEKIEQVTDDDMFRDSAVYSDQDEHEEMTMNANSDKIVNKTVTRLESMKRTSSFKSQKVSNVMTVTQKSSSLHARVLIKSSKLQNTDNISNKTTNENIEKNKPKVAPPVPVKPKISNIQSPPSLPVKSLATNRNNSFLKPEEASSSSYTTNLKTIKRNINFKQTVIKSDSTPNDFIDDAKTMKDKVVTGEKAINNKSNKEGKEEEIMNPHSIQMKRMGFERASLDSATRKMKTTNDSKRSSIEPPKIISKSVLERRLEIEQMTKNQALKPTPSIKKPTPLARPKSINTKLATYERSISENSMKETTHTPNSSVDRENIPINRGTSENNTETNIDNDTKNSWVRQVVHKFQ